MRTSSIGFDLRIAFRLSVLPLDLVPSHFQALEPASARDEKVDHGEPEAHRGCHPQQCAR